MPATIPDHTGHTPGAGWDRAREALGWPDLDDDPEVVAEFDEANRKAQEEAERFWRERRSSAA